MSAMREKLLRAEAEILDALRASESLQPHDAAWGRFVTNIDAAKVAIWRAMDDVPEEHTEAPQP